MYKAKVDYEICLACGNRNKATQVKNSTKAGQNSDKQNYISASQYFMWYQHVHIVS